MSDYKHISAVKTSSIKDLDLYNYRMTQALMDKLFFLDKVGDTSVFADYGCADGALLELAHRIHPQATYIGYDSSEEMIEEANKKHGDKPIVFLRHLNAFQNNIASNGGDVCLILSSLIHEIYHYGPGRVESFWDFVFNKDHFKYVAIRDMCVSKAVSRQSDPISIAKVRQRYDSTLLSQWESAWGSLNDNWSLVHFLLKYRYVENWDRELPENYLPLSYEDLLSKIPADWEPVCIEHYTLPFIRQKVKEDFDVDLQDRTHIKLLLKHNN